MVKVAALASIAMLLALGDGIAYAEGTTVY